MLWDYVEVNPFSGASGSWGNMHKWALPSIEDIMGAAPEPVNVAWGDATQLPYEENAFDAVLTDPPYYSSVPYSNLADMQYVWLHRALKDILPEHFPAPVTPKKAEIMQDNARHESGAAAKSFFEERLSAAFAEIRRVLKPDGIALVMYAHTDTSAWETLVAALIRAGFQVTASWPVNTETRSRQVWLSAVVLQSTIFLICRKRTGKRTGYLDEILPAMRQAVQQALARFWAAGIGGADFFISAIGPALSVYSRYDEVRYSSGQRVSVVNFLTLVRQAVVDFSLQQALQGVEIGEVDRETQFALLWRWTYGHKKVETGAALLLDKATGVELGAWTTTGAWCSLGRRNAPTWSNRRSTASAWAASP
jgi:adenine-specific DNA methylase